MDRSFLLNDEAMIKLAKESFWDPAKTDGSAIEYPVSLPSPGLSSRFDTYLIVLVSVFRSHRSAP